MNPDRLESRHCDLDALALAGCDVHERARKHGAHSNARARLGARSRDAWYRSTTVQLIDPKGRKIHCREEGAGAPVVLVHSGGLSSRQWTRTMPRLSSTHHAIAIDLLGAGESDGVPPEENFDFADDVAALDALLDTLSGPYHLVGHSYGGLIAITSARKRPAHVVSISLFEPVAFGVLYSKDDRAGIEDLEQTDPDGTFLDDATGGTAVWMERFIDWWQGRGAWRALPDPSKDAFLKVGRKVFQEVRSLLADRTPHDAYRGLEMPALIMTAEKSPLAARRVCAILAESMPHAELVSIEGAGHMAPLTHANIVAERIAAHVRAAS